MHAWEQIQQTIEYIEEHLDEKINIEDLAKKASLSPFYYQRLFSRLVKKPVGEYIKLRRMAKGREALLQKDKRILDIALDLGFSSHEHFSRTFKDTFGMTPIEYRNNPITLSRMTKPELSLQYTLVDEGVPLITDGIVLEVNRRIITEPTYFIGINLDVPISFAENLGIGSGVDPLDTLWNNFHEQKETTLGIAKDSEEIGVVYPCQKEGYFTYFAGAKTFVEDVPQDFMNWTLPEGEYIVCSFEAENFEALVMDALYKAEQYIYGTWLPSHKIQTDVFCAERYATHSQDTTNMEIWLKRIN